GYPTAFEGPGPGRCPAPTSCMSGLAACAREGTPGAGSRPDPVVPVVFPSGPRAPLGTPLAESEVGDVDRGTSQWNATATTTISSAAQAPGVRGRVKVRVKSPTATRAAGR